MNLNNIESRLKSTLETIHPSNLEVLNILEGHLLGRGMVLVPGNGTRSHDLIRPATNLSCSDGTASEPRSDCGGFAAGVSKLDRDQLALRVGEFDSLAERLDLAVLPEAGVFGSDAAW